MLFPKKIDVCFPTLFNFKPRLFAPHHIINKSYLWVHNSELVLSNIDTLFLFHFYAFRILAQKRSDPSAGFILAANNDSGRTLGRKPTFVVVKIWHGSYILFGPIKTQTDKKKGEQDFIGSSNRHRICCFFFKEKY